jgi:hypothetical protein
MSRRRTARTPDLGLAAAARIFFAQWPPRLLLLALLGTVAWHLTLPVSAANLVPLVAVPLVHPFVEWLVHVFILHHRPRKIGGFTLDFHAARHHRAHHRDPWDLRFVVMPLPAAAAGTLVSTLAWTSLLPISAAATALVLSAVAALAYEWVHFLTHTSYRPRGRLYRRLWRLHRLHHFKNENYWFGVTRHLGDIVLRTMPDPDSVPTSDTARTLGVDAAPERG